jgi:hypothetical protein
LDLYRINDTIWEIFVIKNGLFLLLNTAFHDKLIILLDLEKITFFHRELVKISKIVIITCTPGHTYLPMCFRGQCYITIFSPFLSIMSEKMALDGMIIFLHELAVHI